MTNEQFIEKAVKHLITRNKVEEEDIERPIVHDTKAVYFKIRPDVYGMMTFDSQTGEQIMANFGVDPFLKQGPINSK